MNNLNLTVPILPAITAAIGVVVGSGATWFLTRAKAKWDRSKELMTLAVQAGMEAFKADRLNHGETELRNMPMSFYLRFHYEFLHLVEDRSVTPEAIKKR